MAGPGDEVAAGAGGHGRLRASYADREQVIGVLKAAFVHGRLDRDELDLRLGQALASRTRAELAVLTADLPSGPVAVPRPAKAARARTRPPASKVVAGAALIVPAPAMVVALLFAGSEPLAKVAVAVVLISLLAWIAAAAQIVASWRGNRSGGQLPPRRAQRGQAFEGEQDAGTGDDLVLSEARRDVRACHLPGHGAAQRSRRSLPVRRGQRRPTGLQVTA
jgi:Domain of unknown function (DUF1707)